MSSTVSLSVPPSKGGLPVGGSITGQVSDSETAALHLLVGILDRLAEGFFNTLIVDLANEEKDNPFEPLAGPSESTQSIRMVETIDHVTIIINFEITSWKSELEKHAFRNYFHEKMKPTWLQLFKIHEFDTMDSDPEDWYRMFTFGISLLDRQVNP